MVCTHTCVLLVLFKDQLNYLKVISCLLPPTGNCKLQLIIRNSIEKVVSRMISDDDLPVIIHHSDTDGLLYAIYSGPVGTEIVEPLY